MCSPNVRRLAAALLLAGCGPAPGVTRPAPHNVQIQGSIQRYEILGSTHAEIGAALRDAARREAGFVGHYSSRLRWNYRFAPTGMGNASGCRIAEARVEMISTIRIPEWRAPEGAPADLVETWRRYSTALEDHERQHERIAVEAAGEIVRVLERMRDLTCERVSRDANAEAGRLAGAMQDRQAAFDRETRHGATTGAVWPRE